MSGSRSRAATASGGGRSLPDWTFTGPGAGEAPNKKLFANGILASLSLGVSREGGWFDRLGPDARLELIERLLLMLDQWAPGVPKLLVTPGGFLVLEQYTPARASRAAQRLTKSASAARAVVFLGIDSPVSKAMFPRGPGRCAAQQSIVGIYRGRVSGPAHKMCPAPVNGKNRRLGFEQLDVPRAIESSYQFHRRLMPTPWGNAYPAVCHDIFGVRQLHKDHDKRVELCTRAPFRSALLSELPNRKSRRPALVLNCIHRFYDSAGYFPKRSGEVAVNLHAPVLSAVKFIERDDSSWKAARLPRRERGAEADFHWGPWNPKSDCDWLWIQAYTPKRLGLPRN